MTTDATTLGLLTLLALAIIALVLLRRADRARRRKRKERAYPDYIEGLHLLLKGRRDDAARAFRTAIESGPYALEARLRLGDLLRARGAVEQATRLHSSLIAAPTLPAAIRRTAAIALADDYRAAGKIDASIDAIQRALVTLGSDEPLLLRLLQGLEEAGRWDRALETAKELEKISARSAKPRAALYRVERAREALATGNTRRARADLRKALIDDPRCGPARLLSGDTYVQQGEIDKALAEWHRLAEEVPELESLAYSRIERALYDAGDYGRVLEIYRSVLDTRPGDVETLCRLARHDERIGSLEKAAERAQQAADAEPDAIYPKALMAAILADMGRSAESSALCRDVAQRAEQARVTYRCSHCGRQVPEFEWRCGSCGRVDAYVRSATS